MIELLQHVKKHAMESPDRIAIVDQEGKRKTSFRELYDMSLRLASWLHRHDIGREKVVAISTPRGVQIAAARLSVMMMGAGWVVVEDMMGAERIDYIIKDSGAVLVIDEKNFGEAMKEEPIGEEYCADPDPHDMAFIIYTSGSTGRAKGVVQEYGIYEYIIKSTYRCIRRFLPVNYANVSPETYIGGIFIMAGALSIGCRLHIIPLELLRNPAGLLTYFRENEIHATCMPPTLAKVLIKMGGPDLKVLHIAGEIATDIYTDHFPVMNAYGPTEFAYMPFFFELDRAYKNTPVGTAEEYTRFILLDDDGEKNASEGVLCIELPYFRGYLHDEKKDYFINVDSVTYFRTGDYVKMDEKGNVTILGRVDDMVKINGNRIEPAEVEFAVKKVLDTDLVAVKVWERGGSNYLCAYHQTGKILNPQEMAEKLKEYIPAYMIPSCYISIDKIPLNANGKVDKLVLPEPDDSLIYAPYRAPENELQSKLCELFASILETGDRKPGIDDDFFLLGGDSLSAISLVTHFSDERLTVPVIYKERTVRNISGVLESISEKEGNEALSWHKAEERASGMRVSEGEKDRSPSPEKEGHRHYPLSDEQRYFLDQELLMPGRVIYNLPVMLSFTGDMEDEVLREALRVVWKAHPALETVMKRNEKGWGQQISGDTVIPEIRQISEEKLSYEVKNFVRPLFREGSPLFRLRLFRTSERVVLLLDVHHIICDGESLRIVVEDILSACDGNCVSADSYYTFLRRQTEGDREKKKDREYFRTVCSGGYDKLPEPDFSGEEHRIMKLQYEFGFGQEEVHAAAKRFHISVGSFYMLASALTISAYNHTEKVMFTWNYNGRSDIASMRTVGLMIRDFPVALCTGRDVTLKSLARDLVNQQKSAILHGSVSPFMERGRDEMLCFLYQGRLMEEPERPYLMGIDYPTAREQTAIEPLELKIYEEGELSSVEINYDAGMYRQDSMESFLGIYAEVCRILLRDGSENLQAGEIVKKAGLYRDAVFKKVYAV